MDHAGETAAVWIYAGQMALLGKDKRLRKLLQVSYTANNMHGVLGILFQDLFSNISLLMTQDMKEQEDHLLDSFDIKIVVYRVRLTFVQHIAASCGFAFGAITALMGEKSAMTCTEAVETTIGTHYDK